MNVVYDKYTGNIEKPLPDNQNYLVYYKYFSQEFRDKLEVLHVDVAKEDWDKYRVIENTLVRKSEDELNEIKEYGNVLTEAERVNLLLQPSSQEIQKAELTIEILSILEEVLK